MNTNTRAMYRLGTFGRTHIEARTPSPPQERDRQHAAQGLDADRADEVRTYLDPI